MEAVLHEEDKCSPMMAGVTIDIPVTISKFEPKDAPLRRKSTGTIQTSGAKILPRYLRTSTGSCHDFCKYGTKHVPETKVRSPFPKSLTATPNKSQYPARSVNLVQIRKKSAITPKPSPQFKSQTMCEIIKKEVPASTKKVAVSSKQVSSPAEGIHASAEHASVLKLNHLQTKASSLSAPRHLTRRHSEIILPKGLGALHMTSMGGTSSRRNSEIKINKDMGTSQMSKKYGWVPATASPSPKTSAKRMSRTKSGNNIPKKASPVKIQHLVRKAETEQPHDEEVPEKTLYVIEPKAENQSVGLAENATFSTHCSQFSEDMSLRCGQTGMQTSPLSPSSVNKNLRCNQNDINAIQFSSSSSLSSESKDPGHTQNGTPNTLSSSPTTLSSKSMHNDESGPVSEHKGTETKNQITGSKVEQKRRPRRIGRVSSEDRDCSPRKLKFRRGKVVNVQAENISPRRLKFRHGRVLGEDQNGKVDARGRSLRKIVVDGELNGTKAKSVKVILRHQSMDGKKGTQSLFNNVIEETASKLVQTRKSKVKALVGAFETVISLQDT